jgi:predicted ATPase
MSVHTVLADTSSSVPCTCKAQHQRRRVVLTGGPGAGKTAVLELIRRSFCHHVLVLPESAGIVFGGGFPRLQPDDCARSAQRAIYHVQRELEACADVGNPAVVLCDRGTLDGLAYWPEGGESFWSSLGTTPGAELRRYDTVIQLRTPTAEQGYDHRNPLRTESAASAAAIDRKILDVWDTHPRRFVIEATASFLDKAATAVAMLSDEVPTCCVGPVVLGRS